METYTVSPHRAKQLCLALEVALEGRLNLLDAYSFKAKPGALLVEPINGDPYVFVEPNTAFVFESARGSGTDKLRKRIDASLFFERL